MSNAPVLSEGGLQFRDLNKNGRLDPYEDHRLPIEQRVEDLLAQMTLEEKAGMLFHPMLVVGKDGQMVEGMSFMGPFSTREIVIERMICHFNIFEGAAPRQMAEWYNQLQALAEQSRLGIPVTISSDPRHSFSSNVGASIQAGAFSQWPEPIGLAATGDPELVQRFGDIARQEYLAVGIRVALHPMADLATEPRWARINGTFGEDAQLSASLTAAYIRGFQGASLGRESVACMTKHFPGGGPQKDGEDPHFSFGKEQVYPGNNFDYHLIPFEAAFKAGTAQIMPYYGMPVGTQLEPVGFGFNKAVITGLLREKYGFDGVVCTDWLLLNPIEAGGQVLIEAKCWGVEHLSVEERALKALEAGVDQFGGESCPAVVIGLVRAGRIAESRIDQSVRRLLREKFRLGLFDDPYLSPEHAETCVGQASFRQEGDLAQRRSIVLLKNADTPAGMTLPLRGRPKIYVERIAPEVASEYGELTSQLDQAELAILRISAPYEQREGFLESLFHAGDLRFPQPELERISAIMQRLPTILAIYLDRPAVMPELAAGCAALLAEFGASDAALLDVIFGRFQPSGKLPFELPSSMEAVQRQLPDLPYDSQSPLFPFGYGLTY